MLTPIDLDFLGLPRAIGVYLLETPGGPALFDCGPHSTLPRLRAGLRDGGLDLHELRHLLLSHIHLDHAGASGLLVARWPHLEVWVHERGAKHMADPERLLASAQRLYGEDMDRLWGEMIPVPEENIHVLRGGETLFGGEFEVAYTPGHASHHVSFLHDGTAFVGDVGGVRIAGSRLTIPPSPPPDIDVEKWHASIERITAWQPRRLVMTHFGVSEDVDAQLAELSERLDDWAARARDQDLDAFVAGVRDEVAQHVDAETAAAYDQAAPPEQLYAGLDRYWRKRSEALSAS